MVGRLLEHSFLEHFCLDQFSVIQGKFQERTEYGFGEYGFKHRTQ